MVNIHDLGLKPYLCVWEDMKQFTIARDVTTADELWLVEHHPVYTQGQAGKPEHILHAHNIPIIQTDRGGQVTYHAPGQLVAYVLMDIRRRHLGVRTLVCQLEQVLISLLKYYGISAQTCSGAPGVYVDEKKIASIGLRVKNGSTYHGIALNVEMDLNPFSGINPCGYKTLEMTQIQDLIPGIKIESVKQQLIQDFLAIFEP